ncbi:hypothetical protein SAMN05192574_102502 [Mucilaginibacter gossypiicola]|uniref:Uncharacterized protein n=1 Tax=Mucilaginibacter gossypiicola TaxID=551995 RepID=A0A1H8DX01_9SPHI|nr:hypothetical protein [Mucilaginibacter gossypiicola]SEN11839.1 hypothetical protein SAMN05192574_102502 [Mucilaginibacter gossypiicola]
MYILYKEDTDYLNKLLNLPARGDEQDWDIELADPARLSEFLATFKAYDLTLSVKRAFLALIIASYDDLLQYDPDDDDFYWTSIKKIIDPETHEHIALLEYWAFGNLQSEENSDYGFLVTPRIRAYLGEI